MLGSVALLLPSCVDVDGFGVEGADGVDVPDVEAVAGLPFSPSFTFLPPARP